MKAMMIANPVFNPIRIQLEITTREELDALNELVDVMAPTDSQVGWLNQTQFDFAFKVLCLLRNAARMDTYKETEIK